MSSPVWWTEDPAPLEREHRDTKGDHYGTVQTDCPLCLIERLREERDPPVPQAERDPIIRAGVHV